MVKSWITEEKTIKKATGLGGFLYIIFKYLKTIAPAVA